MVAADQAHADLVTFTKLRSEKAVQLATLTAQQADAIRRSLTAGIGIPEIRRITGLSRSRIYEIRDASSQTAQ